MRSFWSDPYLWIHLAGLASVPIWLELCLLALAVGNPLLPVWLELFLVASIGIAPILWMQWVRPFDIYSLLAVSLKPDQLTEDQRRLLTLFTTPRNRVLAIAVAVLLAIGLQKLYRVAPIAAHITPFTGLGRVGALLLAAIAFLGANLFTQVPVAVLSVLFTRESTFAATLPFSPEQIRQNFTLLGLPVNQILPPLIPDPPRPSAIAAPPPSPVVESPAPSAVASALPEPAAIAPEGLPAENGITADLDDIWGSDDSLVSESLVSESLVSESLVSESLANDDLTNAVSPDAVADEAAPLPELPDEKPDFGSVEVKTEEAKTEGPDPAMVEVAEESTASLEEPWLDAPAIADPAAAEPPN